MKNTRLLIFNIINIVFFVYAICLSTGYAIFSDTLSLTGIARTVEYYPGPNLPVTPLITDTANNAYYSYSSIRSCETYTDNYHEWVDNKISVTHTKSWCFLSGSKTVTYKASFRNDTALTMTDGVASYKIVKNDSNRITSASASLSKTTILPGETAELILVITTNFTGNSGTQNVLGTYAFTFQNSTKYVYFDFTYKPA